MLTAAVAMAAGLSVGTGIAHAQSSKEVPITIVINQSPWFDGFQAVVEKYEKETGNQVDLDVNPFAGSLEKQRNAVRSKESPYDILVMNAGFFIEMYQGGFLEPLTDVDPQFKLDKDIYTFDDSVYWDAKDKRIDAKSGKLMSVPINPYIPLLHYRSDLYKEKGLKVPQTWDELLANAKALNDPPQRYGIVQRGARGTFDVTFDVLPYLWSYGGGLFKDQKGGDFTVTVNSGQSEAAMKMYLKLAKEAGHPSTAGQTQTNVIQAMATGRAGHIIAVLAAGTFDDPDKSIVVDDVGFAPPPHAKGYPSSPPLGHWLGGIPHNIPKNRQKAALAFLNWFQSDKAQRAYAEAGSPPVSRAVLESDMANQQKYRWMKPLAEALKHARLTFVIPESAQVLAITELRFNQIIAGDLKVADGLNKMADEISAVMKKAGYKAPELEPLKD
ncbi:ABC transporter substrate-binding protein [Pararhizobium mangrovi]|uniref:ABC transporter substrate-binding protein n=1 Tax=Pararhizobium mangrovi TaxID=2590452 RepID=UPI0015E84A84|nr:sugar ABC transporter substrate-binding protein [Pararhizobium mangrovi]